MSRPGCRVPGWGVLIILVLAGSVAPPGEAAEEAEEQENASIAVRGLGWWRNRELRETVQLLKPEEGFGSWFDAAFVEDAVVLLQSTLEQDGFLHPTGTVELRFEDGSTGEFSWADRSVPEIPRDRRANHARFEIEPGVRYTFANLQFSGLTALESGEARDYFVEEGFLFGGAATREFSPSILRRGVGNLQEELVRRGYADARVEIQQETRDDQTGEVDVIIAVDEGHLHRVAEVQAPANVPAEVEEELRERSAAAADEEFSPLWRQGFMQGARGILYAHGYAQAQVHLEGRAEPELEDGVMQHELRLRVEAGPLIHVGSVHFAGDERTHESLLRRTTKVEPGEVFDRSEIEQDRVRLGSLGVFSSIQSSIDEVSSSRWDVTYDVTPANRVEASLLFGYGSYEKLRGGVEVAHTNLLGEAHRGRLQLIYSQKSASGDYLYTVPQIFGTVADVSARLFGLEREEVSYDRRVFGASVGVRRQIEWYNGDAALRYQYEFDNLDIVNPEEDEQTDPNIASLTLDLTRDKLDNPITPREGLLLNFTLETAMQALGSEVDYQRVSLRASWHSPVGREKYLHIGLRHGLVYALKGLSVVNIPRPKRFSPGGESSVRGYTEGRAAPRNADGTVIGAEVSTVLNVEFEQGLANNLSAVVFVDAGLTAAALEDYPGNETRISLGLGLRYNTPIGPARLEYGHNVVREPGDGSDAWHLSLGYPF